MHDVVNQITANPLFSVVLALLALLLIFLVLKSLFIELHFLWWVSLPFMRVCIFFSGEISSSTY